MNSLSARFRLLFGEGIVILVDLSTAAGRGASTRAVKCRTGIPSGIALLPRDRTAMLVLSLPISFAGRSGHISMFSSSVSGETGAAAAREVSIFVAVVARDLREFQMALRMDAASVDIYAIVQHNRHPIQILRGLASGQPTIHINREQPARGRYHRPRGKAPAAHGRPV